MTDPSELTLLARVAGSLVVVLLLAALAARLARRTGRRGGHGSLAVRERVGLTRDAAAVVLEVGDRTLLLGVSAQQITLLAELDAPGTLIAAAPDALPVAPGPRAVPAQRPAPGTSSPPPLTRRELRESGIRRRAAVAPTARAGTGSPLDPRTWQQGLEALRDLTARKG
jgi:flagellar protein FliO/FliZ